MKIVFMGTPDFAVDALYALHEAGHEILLVVTQPDRPKGRSNTPVPCPVKEAAVKLGLTVYQPERIKRPEAVAELYKYPADAFVVAAFGQILSKEILDMPKYGCINIHASLLPKYRGAAPIQWSVLNGEKETGVTIMLMNEGLDTGDILTQSVLPITEEDTGDSMFDKLKSEGARLLIKTLPKVEKGEITPIKQPEESPTEYACMLTKEMGRIHWTESAEKIAYYVRGLNSWPCAYTFSEGKSYKIKMAHAVKKEDEEAILSQAKDSKPGSVVFCDKDHIYVKCGEGILAITCLQPEGKKQMSAHDFLLGKHLEKFED